METLEITYDVYDLEVKFEYSPGEEMVMYYPDGSGYPGSAPDITLGSVVIPGLEVDIFPLLTREQVKEIEGVIWDRFHEAYAD